MQADTGQAPVVMFYVSAIPPALVVLHLCFVLLGPVRRLPFVQTAWRTFSAPFRNFMRLEDLLEPADLKPPKVLLQQRLLLAVACLEVIAWVGRATFQVYTAGYPGALLHGSYALSWVCERSQLHVMSMLILIHFD